MGRAFEYRKERKMKRWANMAKTFTRIGREIAIAVKEGGADPEYNPRLRLAIQNAKTANMPKANVENAIKKATSKDAENYEELVYEGYAPHGVALMVETATDNPTRTVASVRHIFSKYGGNLSTSGSVDYMFSRKANFKVKAEGQDKEELELDLIDFGLEELKQEEDKIVLVCAFEDYGNLQKGIEEFGLEVTESELVRIPSHYKELTDSEVEDVIKLIEIMEDDDDVNAVFHNMKED
ncbi:YebC/PmpR family DNA-binding transcriptional regulator [Phaeodactylibacter sp.]|uniref:YebC/PmpR family DNA-binding transcriptional regulator n=1 Tax=Phaeodactylibacter sp. TaxID=1940289 RepID=UPI0025DE79D9|nr:YebC/PmpR family DNA-binding transcriptional regulator [Phaeodactylibacter sp.]MCI4647817.1 YebC/PmpR family DNA-binding transcriptional regulator [Phaeodactylibacter sp.]MCI5092047.1 YebC/PmpR family DNA-binding transcriptional regulator [Phaeodactylibacter sp.]